MNKIYFGIDNGVSGTIGVRSDDLTEFIKTPTKSEQSYTKAKQNITRIKVETLVDFLSSFDTKDWFAIIERPMVNPGRFKATVSALRAMEATLNVIELLGIPYQYIDSKEWQKVFLPKEAKGEELKTASKDVGCRLFPQFKELITKHGDADGLLIAEFAKRKNF